MDMTQTYSGKRVGGACDTMEMANKLNAAAAKAAEVRIPEPKAARKPGEAPGHATEAAAKSKSKKAATESVEAEPKQADNKAPSPTGNPSVDDVLDTAKKLKGLLGY